MYNSHYFLRHVSAELQTRLRGFQLVSCFSQSRDELVIEFHKGGQHYFVRASLLAELAIVTFPHQIRRARKNSVDLFADLILKSVEGAHVFENDRSFEIKVEGGFSILFKMHGNRANVLQIHNDKVVDIFRKGITPDKSLVPGSLSKEIDWTAVPLDPRRSIVTFTREVWHYLDENGYNERSAQDQWQMILDTKTKLESTTSYYHIEYQNQFLFSLLPFGKIIETFQDPLEAVTSYASIYLSRTAFERERANQLAQTEASIKKTEAYLKRTRAEHETLKADGHFQVFGDLLMANLGKVAAGETSVTLPNFYDGDALVTIKVNPTMTPQKNAEAYYRKAKNRSIELKRSQELLIAKEMQLIGLKALAQQLNASTSLQEVRGLVSSTPSKKDENQPKLPYREVEHKGFRIWIGKDAAANDELTTKFGYKEDLWLHAKDVAGSHVLLKHQAGKKFPKDVIERAAQLAAFYSKRKTDTLCPVAYTPRKFVRKRKGDPAGMVVVEKENVILVEPKGSSL